MDRGRIHRLLGDADVEAERAQTLADQVSGPELAEARLGVTVQVAAPGHQLAFERAGRLAGLVGCGGHPRYPVAAAVRSRPSALRKSPAACSQVAKRAPFARQWSMKRSSIAVRSPQPMHCGCVVTLRTPPGTCSCM